MQEVISQSWYRRADSCVVDIVGSGRSREQDSYAGRGILEGMLGNKDDGSDVLMRVKTMIEEMTHLMSMADQDLKPLFALQTSPTFRRREVPLSSS